MEPIRKKSWRRLVGRLLVGLFLCYALTRIYFRTTDDFRIANMTYPMPHHSEWEIPMLPQEEKATIDSILSQSYYYVGKGAQSYAFSSADDRYILKFFKFKHLKPNLFTNFLPPITPFKQYKEHQVWRKDKLLRSVFDGYHLAYSSHKRDSGILYVHLNPTEGLHLPVIVHDKIGFKRKVDLDSVVFVLQEKAQTTRNIMKGALDEDNLPLAKQRMQQIFNLYFSEYQKGIYDRDHGVMHNTGFVGERPIHLDVGKLTRDETMKKAIGSKADFEKILQKFDVWLKANYPKSYPELCTFLHQSRMELENVLP